MPQDTWYLAKEVWGQVEPDALAKPVGAAFGPDGNLYVLEQDGTRVHVFDAEGRSLRTWGGFVDPGAISVTSTGEVYVGYRGGVQVFDLQGNSRRTVDAALSVVGLVLDASFNIYVIDGHTSVSVLDPKGPPGPRTIVTARPIGDTRLSNSNFNVIKGLCLTKGDNLAVLFSGGSGNVFDANGFYTIITIPPTVEIYSRDGTKLSEFNVSGQVTGLGVDGSDNFHVCMSTGEVVVYSSSGTKLREFGVQGSGAGQLSAPSATVTNDGKTYVCDSGNSRIAVFDSSGTWIKNFGTYGIGNFSELRGLAVDGDGNVYTGDYIQNNIRKHDGSLNFVKRFGRAGGGDGEFSGLIGLAVSPTRKLYALDESSRVQVFDLEGNFLRKFGTSGNTDGAFNVPSGIAVAPDSRVYVADRDNHRIQVFDPDGAFLFKFGSQGKFNGQFDRPLSVAVSPNGQVAVADSGNWRYQIFDRAGNFIRVAEEKDSINRAFQPKAVSFFSDGSLCGHGEYFGFYLLTVFDQSGVPLKSWGGVGASRALQSFAGGELRSGDMVTAHQDRMLRVWKRTYRVVVPEPGNALPLPRIVSQGRRPGTALVDVDYTVKDADNATVQTAALAFKNGGNSLADVIPIASFAEGTGAKLGANIPTGQIHRFTWDVAKDWATDFGEVQLEILAKDGRSLLNLDFIQIPATGGNAVLKISRSPLTDADFLSVWYWLVATGDPEIRLNNGIVSPAASQEQAYAYGTTTTPAGRAYLFQKMGLREATQAELTRAREAGTPGVINKWPPKLQVGPGERPSAVNAYNFDSGAEGYWVVPVAK